MAGPELVLIYNDGYPPVLGRDKHPWALGRPAREVWPELWDRVGPELEQVMLRARPTYEEDRGVVLQRGGKSEQTFFTHSFTPILEEDGVVVGVLNIFRETTARVRTEHELRRMFELSHDLLVVTDVDGRIRRINPAVTRLLGWSEAELLAQPGNFLVHPEDRERTQRQLGELVGGRPSLRFENRYRHKDGSYRWLSWTAAPPTSDGSIYAAARDITDLQRAREQERLAAEIAAFRLRLSDTLRPLAEPIEVKRQAARVLGEALGATCVYYGRVSDDGEHVIVSAEYAAFGTTSLTTRNRLDEYGSTLAGELRSGRTVIIADVESDARLGAGDRTTMQRLGVAAYVAVPLVKLGRMVAVLVVQQSSPRAWTSVDVDLIETTAERTYAAVERARVEDALRESEVRLRQTLRYASAGVFDWNIESGEVFWSPENYELLGVDPAEVIKYPRWEQTILPEDVERANADVQAAIDGTVPELHTEYRILHPTRGVRWMLGVGRVERGLAGQPVHMRGLSLDITERKRAEEELREADRRKSEFLAILSHELRNPLAPIRHGIQLLRSVPADSELAKRTLEILDRQSAHLSHLVDDLLDLTRISRGKIRLERRRFDLRDVVRLTVEDLRASFDEHGVELRVELDVEPVWVDADETRIAQIVANLLTNALKFTPGGVVTVGARVEPGLPEPAFAELVVRDTGVGMSPDDIGRMFEPFTQADQSLARSLGGLGLGLSFVRSLIQLHGGTVEAHSEGPERGAEFIVRLPLAASRQLGLEPFQGFGAAGSRILVIEDNPDAGQTLVEILALRGHDVRLALDGRSGVLLAHEFRPEFVICDLGLPDMSGHDVARMLRANPALGSVKLIALSGYAQQADSQRAYEAGFDAHLAKPAQLDQLYALLRSEPAATLGSTPELASPQTPSPHGRRI